MTKHQKRIQILQLSQCTSPSWPGPCWSPAVCWTDHGALARRGPPRRRCARPRSVSRKWLEQSWCQEDQKGGLEYILILWRSFRWLVLYNYVFICYTLFMRHVNAFERIRYKLVQCDYLSLRLLQCVTGRFWTVWGDAAMDARWIFLTSIERLCCTPAQSSHSKQMVWVALKLILNPKHNEESSPSNSFPLPHQIWGRPMISNVYGLSHFGHLGRLPFFGTRAWLRFCGFFRRHFEQAEDSISGLSHLSTFGAFSGFLVL